MLSTEPRTNGMDFYDDRVAGIARMQSVGTILSSPVVAGRVVYFGSMMETYMR